MHGTEERDRRPSNEHRVAAQQSTCQDGKRSDLEYEYLDPGTCVVLMYILYTVMYAVVYVIYCSIVYRISEEGLAHHSVDVTDECHQTENPSCKISSAPNISWDISCAGLHSEMITRTLDHP